MFQFKLIENEKKNRVLESHIYIFNHCECHKTDDFNSKFTYIPRRKKKKLINKNNKEYSEKSIVFNSLKIILIIIPK